MIEEQERTEKVEEVQASEEDTSDLDRGLTIPETDSNHPAGWSVW